MDGRDQNYLKEGIILNERYQIKKVLGVGGFGITYLAFDILLNIKVAVKEFFPHGIVMRIHGGESEGTVSCMTDSETFEYGKRHFLQEARTEARFQKINGIVRVTDYFEANNTAYYVMEYLEGITLKEYLRENGTISMDDMLDLLVPLIESLDQIHREGLIHRDISPDNIMVLPGKKIKLMDFGAAREYSDYGEKSLSVILKHGFAPPEQYQSKGRQGPWTDIYALCATIYRCITGITPVSSIDRLLDDQLKRPSVLGIRISAQQEKALMKGLELTVNRRYQSVRDLYKDMYGNASNKSTVYVRGGTDQGETERVPDYTGPASGYDNQPQGYGGRSPGYGGQSPGNDGRSPGYGGSTPGYDGGSPGYGGGTSGNDGGASGNGPQGGFNMKMMLVLLLGIIVAGGLIGSGLYVIHQNSLKRTVPNLVNMSMEEASSQAAGDDSSLIVVKDGEEYSDSIDEGKIIRQSVEPGTVLEKGDKISVTVSKGSEKKSEDEAEDDKKDADKDVSEDVDEDEDSDDELSPIEEARQYDMAFGPVEFEGHAYGVFDYKEEHLKDFWDCVAFCEECGGHMAVIGSEEENKFIFEFLKAHDKGGDPHTFFGYTDDNEEGEWEWVDGSVGTYANWYKGKDVKQPNNKGNEDYARFYGEKNDGTWNDADFADKSYHFICEWE